eukprot:TRINITY_DN3093_c3_g3_i1.p1 TRINITY_DN3093_c3_g3~~TRINITY_DN3093_c3_g3_i1.p1  ORF type:complete len:1184 (+),score=378.48 TRINITY_DN3093_c3_g3_i1:114-3665(+)
MMSARRLTSKFSSLLRGEPTTPPADADAGHKQRRSMLLLIGNRWKPSQVKANPHLWTMFVQANDGADYIESVTFILHASFKQPELKMVHPPFEFTRVGWGTFTVQVRVRLKPSAVPPGRPNEVTFRHLLQFGQPVAVRKHTMQVLADDAGQPQPAPAETGPWMDMYLYYGDTPPAERAGAYAAPPTSKKTAVPAKAAAAATTAKPKPGAPRPAGYSGFPGGGQQDIFASHPDDVKRWVPPPTTGSDLYDDGDEVAVPVQSGRKRKQKADSSVLSGGGMQPSGGGTQLSKSSAAPRRGGGRRRVSSVAQLMPAPAGSSAAAQPMPAPAGPMPAPASSSIAAPMMPASSSSTAVRSDSDDEDEYEAVPPPPKPAPAARSDAGDDDDEYLSVPPPSKPDSEAAEALLPADSLAADLSAEEGPAKGSVPFHELVKEDALGRGAFGNVVAVTHQGRALVLKTYTLPPDVSVAAQDLDTLRAFPPHPSLVRCLDVYSDPESVSVLLERMDASLDQLRQRVEMPVEALSGLLQQLFSPLIHLHTLRVPHGCVLPSEVLVDVMQGSAKLSDPRHARLLENKKPESGALVVHKYSAPETLRGAAPSSEGDIWMVGVLMLELASPGSVEVLCGRMPLGVVLTAQEKEVLLRSKPATMREFASACLALDPAQRPSAVDLTGFGFVKSASDQTFFREWVKEVAEGGPKAAPAVTSAPAPEIISVLEEGAPPQSPASPYSWPPDAVARVRDLEAEAEELRSALRAAKGDVDALHTMLEQQPSALESAYTYDATPESSSDIPRDGSDSHADSARAEVPLMQHVDDTLRKVGVEFSDLLVYSEAEFTELLSLTGMGVVDRHRFRSMCCARARAMGGNPLWLARPEVHRPPKRGEGMELGDLEVAEDLGSGHFGKVCRAVWKGHDVAIKMLHSYEGVEARNFRREIEHLKSICHPNVVAYLATVSAPGGDQLVTEYCDAGSLESMVTLRDFNQFPLTASEVLDVGRDVAQGLFYMQCVKKVHRDVAARNVLASAGPKGGRVYKVGDVGLCRDLSGGEHEGSETPRYARGPDGQRFAPRWTSPETNSTQVWTTKSDVWSFGITLWEVLTYARGVPYRADFPDDRRAFTSKILPQPANCNGDVWGIVWKDVVERCFKAAADRPKFEGVLRNVFAASAAVEREAGGGDTALPIPSGQGALHR